jgi:ABC-type phosphonate transport system ATPase subunit
MFSSLFNLLCHMRNFLDREALFLWSNSWKFFKVVYMDEPSTGLDPASRNNLWNVVKRAKQDRAIILTSKLSLSLSLSLCVVEFESPETL